MDAEEQLRKVIRQMQEKIASLTIENQLLKQRLGIYSETPQFTTEGIGR
jgi:regulator of replication initiation timing